ncbi:MAG TPA: LUD domain-containing protein, partial [Chryseolinea sp.]|nr:LUD domain-containing protein [Chryseolinea sp.]
MESREKILSAVLKNQPAEVPLPTLKANQLENHKYAEEFIAVLERIGGKVIIIQNYGFIVKYVETNFGLQQRIVSTIEQLPWYTSALSQPPRTYENVDLAILKGHFGVAENGAIWVTDKLMGNRSIPFISHHLSLVINRKDIVPTLHEAYDLIESYSYNFGTFIAGPSKTADIEQSLVLGAHGPKSLVVFLLTD